LENGKLLLGSRHYYSQTKLKKVKSECFLFGYDWKMRSYYGDQDTTIHKKKERKKKKKVPLGLQLENAKLLLGSGHYYAP